MNPIDKVLSIFKEMTIEGTCAPVTLTMGKEFSSTFVKVHNAPPAVVRALVLDLEFVSLQEDGLYIGVNAR